LVASRRPTAASATSMTLVPTVFRTLFNPSARSTPTNPPALKLPSNRGSVR
jgi:hypothetical protein